MTCVDAVQSVNVRARKRNNQQKKGLCVLEVRRNRERGYTDLGWATTWHTFSTAEFYDPEYIDYAPLRVIDDHRIKPGRAFGAHEHRDTEILSYVLDGELEHKDSAGNVAVLKPGELQRMSSGRGIVHSESNPSATQAVQFLQIWITASTVGGPPAYERRSFPAEEKRGRLRLIASPDGEDDSVFIRSKVRIYVGLFDAAERMTLNIRTGRRAFLHVARGSIAANDTRLNAGDGAKITQTGAIELQKASAAELLVFDLPAPRVGPG